MITVVSVIRGMNRYVLSTITESGSNVFRIDRFGLITSHEAWLTAMRRKDLTLEDMELVKKECDLCTYVSAFSLVPSFSSRNQLQIDVTAGRQKIEDPNIFGVTASFAITNHRELSTGRYITEWEEQHAAFSAVLGYEIAQALFPQIDPIGKTVHINSRKFQVVGILKKYGNFFGENRDTLIEIPISSFRKVFGKREPVFIYVKVEDNAKMTEAQDQARVLLRSKHHRRYEEDDGFAIMTTDALVELWQTFTAGAFAAMIGISSIALIVGGIVIMNIMLVSVVERTSEIGLRKALGARSKDVKRQFLLESVILAAVGGAIGVLLGAIFGKLISVFSPLPSILEPGPVIAGLLLASSVGLVSGFWPAVKAAKLDPIVALRSE